MSLKSWMKEFYPTAASSAAGSWSKAAAHSLRKWEGTSKANLKKHGVVFNEMGVTEPGLPNDQIDTLYFDGQSCALCRRAEKRLKDAGDLVCTICPLAAQEGNDCLDDNSAFAIAIDTQRTTRMINALRRLDKTLKAGTS